jgi:RNA polymerase sigma factor (sigma-70 family)
MSVRAPALRGDEAQLFAAHHAALRGRVARHAGTRASNIDDACSFAWLQLLRWQPERGKTLEWLTTVAIREARRLEHADRRLALLEAAGELHTQSNVLTHEQAREALEVVAVLPECQRLAFALHVAGLTYSEIAAATGRSVRSIDRHLRLARRAVRDRGGE